MAGELRSYRGSPRLLTAITVTAGTGTVTAITPAVFATWMDPGEKLLICLPIAVGVGVLLARAWRAGTSVSADGITARGLFSTIRMAWAEILQIRIQQHVGPTSSRDGSPQIVMVYLASGRTVILPQINRPHLATERRDLDTELAFLTDEWRQRRGPSWRAAPAVVSAVTTRANAGANAWMAGFSLAAFGLVAMIIVDVIGLLTGAGELAPGLAWVFNPVGVLVVPAFLYVIGIVAARRP